MTGLHQATEFAKNKMQIGEINADQANVLIVQIMGARLISGSLPASVRKALNAAVKAGELGHIKKEGLRPEAYHHKNGRARALDARNEAYRNSLEAIKGVMVPHAPGFEDQIPAL
jgi:hypothetical protein